MICLVIAREAVVRRRTPVRKIWLDRYSDSQFPLLDFHNLYDIAAYSRCTGFIHTTFFILHAYPVSCPEGADIFRTDYQSISIVQMYLFSANCQPPTQPNLSLLLLKRYIIIIIYTGKGDYK